MNDVAKFPLFEPNVFVCSISSIKNKLHNDNVEEEYVGDGDVSLVTEN